MEENSPAARAIRMVCLEKVKPYVKKARAIFVGTPLPVFGSSHAGERSFFPRRGACSASKTYYNMVLLLIDRKKRGFC